MANDARGGPAARALGHLGRQLEPLDRRLRPQALDLARVDEPGAETLRRLCPAGDPEAQALVGWLAAVARGDEAREEGVAAADRRDGLARLDPDAEQRRLAARPRADRRDAAVGQRHDRLLGPEPDELAHGDRAVLVVVELVPDELLGLEHVGRDDVGLGADGEAHGLAVAIDDRRHAHLAQVADQRGVDVGLDAARQRSGEDYDVRAAREVEQLVVEEPDLGREHLRAALVDLGLLAVGGVEHRGVRARLVADAHEVVEDRLLGELLDDARPGRSSGEPGGDHRLAERLERARYVDALAARHGALLDGPVATPEPEVRHGERLVDGGVERDGDDHATPLWRCARRPRSRRRRQRTNTRRRVPSATAAAASTRNVTPSAEPARSTTDAAGTAAAVTSATRSTTRPRQRSSTVPTRVPLASGPRSSLATPVRR